MNELQSSINNAGYIMFAALALALNEEFGWKKDHIKKVLSVCQEVWIECSQDSTRSMIEMCYQETGIAVTNDSGKDFEQLSYLSETYWQEAKKHLHFKTKAQELLYLSQVRKKQCEWMEAVVTSGIFLALHRREGFGYDRNSRLYDRMRQIKTAVNNDYKLLILECENKLHLNMRAEHGFFEFEVREVPE